RRNLALQPFAVFGGLTLLLLEFAAPVPVGEDCAGVIYPRRQLVRLLLQRRKLLLGIGDHAVEVGDEAVLAALLDIQAGLAQEGTVAHAGLLPREAMLLDACLYLSHLAVESLLLGFQRRK